ncbi:MAG: TolC family protein [Syntrophaceae bacterium]
MHNKFKLSFVVLAVFLGGTALGEEYQLQDLVNEALLNNPEVQASQARIEASRYRVPQARSLPDPMFMFGYQNDGFSKFTYNTSDDSQFMISASQAFPFYGKRDLKGKMAELDSESIQAVHRNLVLKTEARVKELYYDLFLAYKSLDLFVQRGELLGRIESIAVSRYSSGAGTQQEVLMAQSEKYMLLEREEMQRQKIAALEAVLASTLGRTAGPLKGRPAEPKPQVLNMDLEKAIQMHLDMSPEIQSREKMIEAGRARARMARKEYYPDFTINATVFPRGNDFENMWSLTGTFNIPLYFRSKQSMGVKEADSSLVQAVREKDATRNMIAATLRENYSMLSASEKLIDLYSKGIIPKATQDFELAIAGYGTGRTEAIVVITRVRTLLDQENLYWGQLMEREKAVARIMSITGGNGAAAVQTGR